MKLVDALVDYGLLPWENVMLEDFGPMQEIRSYDLQQADRVDRLIRQFNHRYLGRQGITARLISSDGIGFEGFDSTQELSWSMSLDVARRRGWTCGRVETVYRRFLGYLLDREALPPVCVVRVRALIP